MQTAFSVTQTFWVVAVLVVAFVVFHVLTNVPENGGPTLWARIVMWSALARAARNRVVVAPVDQPIQKAEQPIATSDNAINPQLPGNELLPNEAREIIRFQAKVEALAQLVRDGQVTNMAKGIEKAFQCSRSSKEESTYQRALRMLKPLVEDKAEYRMTPDMVENRKELGLDA